MANTHKLSVQESQNISLGQAGSVLATTDAVTAVTGVFVAIQFIEDSVFESGATGLVAETTQLFPDDTGESTSVSASGGNAIDGVTFPAGMTIYGRWTAFELVSGKAIGYLG
jgi:hypothetical protein